ncbi:MAG: hypothetical protein WCF84_27050 [Anaerolineae bacterium]
MSDPEHGLNYTGMKAFLNHVYMVDLFEHETERQSVGANDENFFERNHPDFGLLCEMG